jgi:hypothetical protein
VKTHIQLTSVPSLPSLKVAYQGVEENVEPLCFINQRRQGVPRPFQPGMPYTHPQYFGGYNSQMHSQPWYPPNPPTWPMQNQWQYPNQPFNPSYQPFPSQPPMKNHQWTNPPQGWRPPNQQQQAFLPPPPQQIMLPQVLFHNHQKNHSFLPNQLLIQTIGRSNKCITMR